MEREDAIELWNSTAQICYEENAQVTHLGTAALAAGAPHFAYHGPPAKGTPAAEHNMKIVRFLKTWAENIEGVGAGSMEERTCVLQRKIIAQKTAHQDELVKANLTLNADRIALREALEESLKLQSHYAKLLNMSDGGQRLQFDTAESWMKRMEEVKANRKKAEEDSCK